VGVGLRKVAPHSESRRLVVLGEQAHGRERGVNVVHDLAGLLRPPGRGEGFDEPERADDEGHGRLAEAVVDAVAEQPSRRGRGRSGSRPPCRAGARRRRIRRRRRPHRTSSRNSGGRGEGVARRLFPAEPAGHRPARAASCRRRQRAIEVGRGSASPGTLNAGGERRPRLEDRGPSDDVFRRLAARARVLSVHRAVES